jgi:PAS domain S-box-containing protein
MQATTTEDLWDRWRLPLLAVAVFLIVVVPSLLLQQMARNADVAANWASHSQEVREQSQRVEAALRDLESAALALSYGIDKPVLRERLADGRVQTEAALARLAELTRDNGDQLLRIGRAQATVERRMAMVEQIAATQDPARVRALFEEMTVGSPIRDLINDLQLEEERLLVQRQREIQRQRTRYGMLSWGALIVQLLLLGTVIWLLQRQIRRRLLAERAFLHASGRASAVLHTVREPIVLLDGAQRVILHNPAFAELYGLDERPGAPAQVPLKDIGEGAWDDVQIQQRLSDILLRGRELWDFEHEQRGADGVPRTMLLNARRMPLPDADDQVVLMTVSDISLQKAAQQRIQELNRQLEGKIEQVSEVNRELEAFSYSVSHDLRAPLRHVAGFADKLSRHLGDESADEKTRHYMDVISSSARRMASLIDDLLVYSRLGRSALRMQAVDMQSLVAETRSILDANLQSEDAAHRLDWRIAPLPILVADENMMRQLWMNLLGNAVKYSAKRDVARIEVGYEMLPDGSHHFSVRDNGAGFEMDYAGKLFGVFQRLHKASEYPGTGIGLASVRRVLSRHGGRIWAEGAVDQGATFHFVLPTALEAPNRESRA